MMKWNRPIGLLLTAALAVSAVGCSKDTLATSSIDQAASDPMPKVPDGARFTICCMTFSGPSHTADADRARDTLKAAKKLNQWYVVNYGDKSVLYYGFYRNNDPRDVSDAEEGKRAVDDQDQIRALSDSQNHHLFSAAMLQTIDAPDPEENPEWDLLKSPGYWTLAVAAFKAGPDRKEKALAVVKKYRSEGKEAYYFHGPNISSVCIGSWPHASVREYAMEHQITDPLDDLVVTTGNVPADVVLPGNHKLMKPTVEIEDPTLKQALLTYSEYDVDGYTKEYTLPDGKTVDDQPLLVRIPNRVDSPSAVINDPSARNDYTSNVPAPRTPTQADPLHDSTTNALHSLYDK